MSRSPGNGLLSAARAKAREIKQRIVVLYLAAKDPRTPWHAKAFALVVIAYAFSPVDLIPDFIPILGLLDDVILLPLGIWLALRMIPRSVIEDCAEQAATLTSRGKPVNWFAGIAIIAIWALVAIWIGTVLVRFAH